MSIYNDEQKKGEIMKVLKEAGIILFFIVFLSGCSVSDRGSVSSKAAQTSEQPAVLTAESSGTKAQLNEEDSSEDTATTVPDELQDNKNDSVAADISAADAAYRKMISEEASGSNVCLVYTDDFENNGTYQAFAFVGNTADEMNCKGQLWFIDKRGKQLLKEDALLENGLSDNDLKLNLGGYKFLKMEYLPSETDIWTSVYGVKGGKPYKAAISDHGSIEHKDDTADFTITVGSYDITYDPSLNDYVGHSWKPYYFYYDGNRFHEYGGKEMTENELKSHEGGEKILGDIKAAGMTVDSIYYHANDIITVNYSSGDKAAGLTYGNAALALRDNKVICVDPYTLQEQETFSETNLDGTYLKHISEMAVYP